MPELTVASGVPAAYLAVRQTVPKSYRYLFCPDGAGKFGFTLAERKTWATNLSLRENSLVFDIGAGSGLWCWVLKNQGHIVTPSNPPVKRELDQKYRQACAALGFNHCFDFRVEKFEPMDLPQKYDLISALKAAFYEGWGRDEWRFFLADVVKYLVAGGQVFLLLNYTGEAREPLKELRNLSLPTGWFWESRTILRYK
jgi:cyclopropane fatty-acyl-phospholipid synthase-like methyltransferase